MKLIADFHTHTVASGHAYSTIEEYAAEAQKRGLKYVAITDHGPDMPGAPHLFHFVNLVMVPEKIGPVRILRGAEVNIINAEGEIDLPKQALERLDVVIVAMHTPCSYNKGDKKSNTRAYLKALDNPYINIIAHPGNQQFPIDHTRIIAKAREKGVLIEINNSSPVSRRGSYDACVEIAREVKRIGWKVAIGSDAHISKMVGGHMQALKICRAAGLKKDDIVNTSADLIEKYILGPRKKFKKEYAYEF